jgi:hypothetical protein
MKEKIEPGDVFKHGNSATDYNAIFVIIEVGLYEVYTAIRIEPGKPPKLEENRIWDLALLRNYLERGIWTRLS